MNLTSKRSHVSNAGGLLMKNARSIHFVAVSSHMR